MQYLIIIAIVIFIIYCLGSVIVGIFCAIGEILIGIFSMIGLIFMTWFKSYRNFFIGTGWISLLTSASSGLLYLITENETAKIVLRCALIVFGACVILSVVIYIIIESRLKSRISSLMAEIYLYFDVLPHEMEYDKLQCDLETKFGNIRYVHFDGTVFRSNDIIEDKLKKYIDRNIDAINHGTNELLGELRMMGVMEKDEFTGKKKNLYRTYKKYCTGDRAPSEIINEYVASEIDEYPLDDGTTIIKDKYSKGGKALQVDNVIYLD